MSPDGQSHDAVASCFPRVSGDEPDSTAERRSHTEFSPRERG